MQLPPDYVTYLRSDSPAFGDLTCADFERYFDLWSESDIEQFNTEYEVQKLAPGFLGFATNGGGEIYAFNQHGQIFELPCIGMEAREAKLLAGSWNEFESRIKSTGEQGASSNYEESPSFHDFP